MLAKVGRKLPDRNQPVKESSPAMMRQGVTAVAIGLWIAVNLKITILAAELDRGWPCPQEGAFLKEDVLG